MSQGQICETCRFFQSRHGGECRRFPPMVRDWRHQDRFPAVDKLDWCGEWRPLADTPPPGRRQSVQYRFPQGGGEDEAE
jgi:hypothetical protein